MKAISGLFGGGEDNSAAEAAKRAALSQQAAEKATQNMQANFATDLSTDNLGTVISAGTASDVASTEDLLKKKKTRTTGPSLSTQLGLNA